MSGKREYLDIPGTYVFDGEQNRKGYHLNMFCKSLDIAANRDAFRADPEGYLNQHPITPEQREAVLTRDWLGLLQLGGNIYYTLKLAIFDGLTIQHAGAGMAGFPMTVDEYRQMMLEGGRSIEGNRSKKENQEKHNG